MNKLCAVLASIIHLFLVDLVLAGDTNSKTPLLDPDKNIFGGLGENARKTISQYGPVPSYVELFGPNTNLINLALVSTKDIQNVSRQIVGTIGQDLPHLLTTPQISEKNSEPGYSSFLECQADLTKVMQLRQPWAQQMFDAWGKPGPGILKKEVRFLGDYDECLDVTTGQPFDSQYCIQQLVVQRVESIVFPQPISFALGVCVPSSCEAKDVADNLNLYLALQPNVSAGVVYGYCKHPGKELSTKAIVVLSVCGFFACLMFLATLYDVLVVREAWTIFYPHSRTSTIWLSDHHANGSVSESKKAHRSEYEPLTRSAKKSPSPGDSTSADSLNILEKLLISFSVYTNGEKLLSTKVGSGTIECINGIRFISMSWVILGHTYVMGLQGMDNVQEYLEKANARWTFQAILSGLLSVDSFFALSGLLMTYLVLKELERKRLSPGFFFKFYFHRFWRLTPPYMLVMMIDITLFHYTADGPLWPEDGVEKDDCEDTWWTNLLYINNVVKDKEMCMGWSWYLANDMQFFVISPIIFIPLFYLGHAALAIPLLMIVGNAIASGVISSENDLDPNIDILNSQANDYFNLYYIKPWCRIGPYLVGIITGYFLYVTECRARLNKVFVFVGWLLAWAAGLAVVYGLYEHTNGHKVTTEVAALYNALHRIGWGVAVCWLIFTCANGYGGFINTILSWKGFLPLSRLTYCAYLVHPLVIYYYYFSHRKLFYLDNINISFAFMGTLVIAYGVAFVASMAFEAPMLGLEKVILGDLVRKIKSMMSPKDVEQTYMSYNNQNYGSRSYTKSSNQSYAQSGDHQAATPQHNQSSM